MPLTPRTRVLVAEDNRDDEMMTLRVLRGSLAISDVLVAHDGAETIELLQRCAEEGTVPDLILLDLKLPKATGLEILQRIKADPRMAEMAVVVFTSSDEPKDIEEARALGASAYVRKPIDYDEFRGSVERIAADWLLGEGAIRKHQAG